MSSDHGLTDRLLEDAFRLHIASNAIRLDFFCEHYKNVPMLFRVGRTDSRDDLYAHAQATRAAYVYS